MAAKTTVDRMASLSPHVLLSSECKTARFRWNKCHFRRNTTFEQYMTMQSQALWRNNSNLLTRTVRTLHSSNQLR